LAKGRPPLRLALSPLPTVGLAEGGSPLRAPHCKRLCPRAAAAPTSWLCTWAAATHEGGAFARRRCPYGRLPPLAGAASFPFGLAVGAASRPLAGGLGHGLAVGGRPCMGASSSLLPSL
ncbi:hypothetical protein BHE74_00052160, partial [Ensete ventricosum]